MRKYETIFILQPDLTEEVVQTISSKVEETIAAGNGHYVRLEDWGTRKLAYPINKSPGVAISTCVLTRLLHW